MIDWVKGKVLELRQDWERESQLKKKAKEAYFEARTEEAVIEAKQRASIERKNRIKNLKTGKAATMTTWDLQGGLKKMLEGETGQAKPLKRDELNDLI